MPVKYDNKFEQQKRLARIQQYRAKFMAARKSAGLSIESTNTTDIALQPRMVSNGNNPSYSRPVDLGLDVINAFRMGEFSHR